MAFLHLLLAKKNLGDFNVGDFFCSSCGADRPGVARPFSVLGEYLSEEVERGRDQQGVTNETPGTGSVGGRCDDHQHQGVVDELFSSEVNLRNYMEVGWRRVYCLEECCKAGCVWLRRGRLQHLLLLGEDLQAVIKSTAAASASVAQCCRSIVLC